MHAFSNSRQPNRFSAVYFYPLFFPSFPRPLFFTYRLHAPILFQLSLSTSSINLDGLFSYQPHVHLSSSDGFFGYPSTNPDRSSHRFPLPFPTLGLAPNPAAWHLFSFSYFFIFLFLFDFFHRHRFQLFRIVYITAIQEEDRIYNLMGDEPQYLSLLF